MQARHVSYAQIPYTHGGNVNLSDVFRFVAPKVRDAAISHVTGLQRDVSGLYGLASAFRSAEKRFPRVFSRLQLSAHAFT